MAATRKRSWIAIIGFTVAGFVVLVLAALTFVALRADAWANDYADGVEQEWSAKLGRPVRIGEIDVSVFGGVVRVDGVEIGAAKGEPRAAPAALTLERAALDASMVRTLLSFGTHPRVESITVDGLQLNVVRLPDGKLNWQHIADRARAQPEPQREPPDERVRNTVVEVARLRDGEVAFIDLARAGGRAQAQPTARISAIDLQMNDAGYERGMTLALQAAALAQERNLSLRASTSGIRERDGRTEPPAFRSLELKLARTELAPLAPFLAAVRGAGALEQGALSADLAVDRDDSGATTTRGNIALADARFGRGERFDAELALDLATDADAGQVNVRKAVLRAGEMSLSARGVVTELDDVPQLRDVSVRSQGLSFDRIRALYPAFDRRTRPAQLAGPFAITATGAGSRAAQHAELDVNLTDASVTVPERFRKPAGTPLRLRAELDTRGDVLDISQLALQLADFRVTARGQVRDLDEDAPHFRLKFETPSSEVGGLVRLLPEVAAALGSERKVPGKLVVSGSAEGTSARYSAQGKLALSGLDVRAKSARFHGGGQAKFALRKQPKRWSAEADADFTQLRAVYPGVLHKPEPTPFTFTAELAGVPGRPAAFTARVPKFAFAAGGSDISGSLRFENLDDPQIAVQARSRRLDLDDFVPRDAQARASEREPVRGRERSRLARADGVISLRVKEGVAQGVPYEDLEAELRIANGRGRAEKLRVSAFGGRLSGTGSEFPLFGAQGPFRVRGELEGMQAETLLARFAGAPELLRGTLGGEIDVTAAGASVEDLRETLSGRLSGSVAKARFEPGNGYAAFAERLQSLSSVPGLGETVTRARERLPAEDDWRLEDLAGALRFEDGAVLVQKPLAMQTPQGKLSLSGRISLSDAGRLIGTWEVEPKAIEALAGTKLDLKEPVPIELRVEGPLTKPRFAFGRVEPVVEQLVRAYGQEQLEGEAGEQIEKALEETGLNRALLDGGKDDEARGAKRDGEDKAAKSDKKKKKKTKKDDTPEDEIQRGVQKLLPQLF